MRYITEMNLGGDDYMMRDPAISEQVNRESIISTYYQGGVTGHGIGAPVSNTTLNSNTNRIRTINANSSYNDAFQINAGTRIRISVDYGYKFSCQVYNKSTKVGTIDNSFRTSPLVISRDEDYAIIVMVGRVNDANLTPSDGVHCYVELWNDVKNDIASLENVLNNTPLSVGFQQGGFTSAGQGIAYTSLGFNDSASRIRNIPNSTSIGNAMLIKAGTQIQASVDEGYKFAYQVYSASSGLALDVFDAGTSDKVIRKNEDVYFIVWVGKIDDSSITPSEGSHFHLSAYNAIKEEIDKVSDSVAELRIAEGSTPVFENRFIPTSLLSLPSGFSSFPIPVQISKMGSMYGYFIEIGSYYKRGTNNATYYVSLNGNDTNDGLTPETALLTIPAAVAKEDVGTIVIMPGIYLNGTHFNSTAISKPLNIIGIGNVVFDSPFLANPLNIAASCYVKNITFRRGTSNLIVKLTDADLCVFDHCRFEKSVNNSALQALGGSYIMLHCDVDEAYGDGFNYHIYNSSPCQVLEICCTGRNCGNNSDSLTSNCSTIHDTGARIIRIGCEYRTSKGCVVADADNVLSLNIAVISSSTIGLDSNTRDGNFGALSGAEMWLYDCISFGSPKDIISDASTLHTTDTYTVEATIDGGTIDRIT